MMLVGPQCRDEWYNNIEVERYGGQTKNGRDVK